MATITYVIINGKWADGTSAPKYREYDIGSKIRDTDIINGMTPNEGWWSGGGSWSPDSPYYKEVTGSMTYTYSYTIPMIPITYEIVNGYWSDGTDAPKVREYPQGNSIRDTDIINGNTPKQGWTGSGSWSPKSPYYAEVTEPMTYTYTFSTPLVSITYEIVNGYWRDGTDTPIVREYALGSTIRDKDILNGNTPKPGYPNSSKWFPYSPYISTVTEDVTLFQLVFGTPHTITYKIVNGTWADGTTTPKTETVFTGMTPANIPEGMIPLVGYKDGEWSPDPYNTVITEDTTFTYECIEIVAIRLIAKKEISSNYMDEDAIATISTSGMAYLNQGDIIYMYGKLVAADQNEVILVIHGPTA